MSKYSDFWFDNRRTSLVDDLLSDADDFKPVKKVVKMASLDDENDNNADKQNSEATTTARQVIQPPKENNFKAKHLEPTLKEGLTFFPLKIGQINQLEISNWQWNQISVGVILIIAVILLSLSLQRFRLQMGFGFPELPP